MYLISPFRPIPVTSCANLPLFVNFVTFSENSSYNVWHRLGHFGAAHLLKMAIILIKKIAKYCIKIDQQMLDQLNIHLLLLWFSIKRR